MTPFILIKMPYRRFINPPWRRSLKTEFIVDIINPPKAGRTDFLRMARFRGIIHDAIVCNGRRVTDLLSLSWNLELDFDPMPSRQAGRNGLHFHPVQRDPAFRSPARQGDVEHRLAVPEVADSHARQRFGQSRMKG